MGLFDRFKQTNGPRQVANEDIFKVFLKKYNCNYEIDNDKDNQFRRYAFDFQGGHFLAFFYDDCKGMEVIFPRFYEQPLEELQHMRTVCNRANTLSVHFKFFYAISDDQKSVDVSISFAEEYLVPELLKERLEHCFVSQRNFIDAFNNIDENAKLHKTNDMEQKTAHNSRETFLLRQQEFENQDETLQFRPNDTEHLQLGQLIQNMLGLKHDAIDFESMQVVCDALTTVAGNDEIKKFDLSTILIEGNGKDAHFKHDHATVIVHCTLNETQQIKHAINLYLAVAGQDESTLYYHVTVCVVPSDIDRAHSLHTPGSNVPGTCTMLVARDLAGALQKQQEFDYMWKDAQIKIKEGKIEELTDEQQLIFDITDANIGYSLYWGREYLRNKAYYQAILYFENAFNALRPIYFDMGKELKQTFFDICYYLGFCYNDLQLYEKAFFFLDIVADAGRIDYAMEFVNTLANSGDVRIFQAIQNIMDDIKEQYDLQEDEEIPDKIQSFINFLRRRRAYALVNFGNFDMAEKTFKKMLDEPENRDYAINELAYIKQQREAQKGDDEQSAEQKEN